MQSTRTLALQGGEHVRLKLRPGTRDRSEGFSNMLRSYANDLSGRLGIQSRIPCRIHYVSPSS